MPPVLDFIGGKVITAERLGTQKATAILSPGATATLVLGGIALFLWQTRGPIEVALTYPALEQPQ